MPNSDTVIAFSEIDIPALIKRMRSHEPEPEVKPEPKAETEVKSE